MSEEQREPDIEPRAKRPASPRPARPDRPAAPPTRAEPEVSPELSPVDYLSSVSDTDDDFVFAPPPEPDAFAHLPAAGVAHKRQTARRMTTQRTLIPILLTAGLLLMFTGALRFVAGETSSVGGLSVAMSAALLLMGGLLLVTGVFNMLYVRANLAAQRLSR